ncbi:MAG TPA: uroporphyrinogen decarboxylase family protein, partial [Cytophagales bacterium]|nr:uroporphyrinogen decarboxylase family protein [Cytophagales bacterium]
MLQNDLILRAAKGEKVDRVPVWMMRQAGRVLDEYKAVRSKFSGFKEFVKNPEAAAEVTIQPVDIFGVDAAIIFSDILVVPEAMGIDYIMEESKGPVFPNPIKFEADIDHLNIEVLAALTYVTDAIQITKKNLNGRVPLIGFAGAPWTIFSYITEGSGSKTFSKAKAWLYKNPKASHKLMDK